MLSIKCFNVCIIKLRDLRHENINPIIGCYTDPKIPALIFEYATRGSLEVSIYTENTPTLTLKSF
jgi:hypothetical protein